MTTLQIKYRDIPSYLHTGDFYRSLDSDDPKGIIEIPADCFHQDGERAADVIKFNQLLSVMEFWMLDKIPVGILHFCNTHSVEVWKQSIADLPGALKQTVQPLLLTVYTKSEFLSFRDVVRTYNWDLIMHAVSRMGNQSSFTVAAARCGHLRLLQHLNENGFAWDVTTCWAAGSEGHVDCLQFAHENGCPWDVWVYWGAAANGHLMCMQYAHQQGLREWHKGVCKEAALGGHFDCLQYAHENGYPWDVEVFKGAARNGHLHCMHYAHSQGLREWHTAVCKEAALGGHLNCLQFAHENGCPWDTDVYYGHLNCMQYAHQQGVEWQMEVCEKAASNGRLDCLEYAHENGCLWDSTTTSCAAEKGHIDCLRYALEHGCPADEWACRVACEGGHVECLQLLHQSGVPCNYAYIASCAAQYPTSDCLKYLYEHGCPWGVGTPDEAARAGHIEPLRYALEHGCPCNDIIVESTARGKNLNCLQYLVENQGLYMDDEVFKAALLIGDLANLQYLLDQGCPFLDAEICGYAEELYGKHVFREDNPEFVLCVEFAVERGWVPCSNFIQFVVFRDTPCRKWFIKEGFYAGENVEFNELW